MNPLKVQYRLNIEKTKIKLTNERLNKMIGYLQGFGDSDYAEIGAGDVKSALIELFTSRQIIKQLIEAIVSVQELDSCVYYDSALATLKHSNPELAKQIFDEHKPEWENKEWENV